MQQIGVRELRQQASRYLKRVPGGDPWQALIDGGQVISAELPGGLLDIEPRDFGIDASAELSAMRALEDC